MKIFLTIITLFILINSSKADWEHMTNGLFADGLVYAYATFDNKIYTTIEYGRFFSTNNGTEWNWADLSIRVCNSLGSNEQRLFAGTSQTGVIYLTPNSGTNWTQTTFSSGMVRSLLVLGNTIIAGFDGGVNISRDNGETWDATLGGNIIYSLVIKENTLFAATFGNGIYKSTNKGFAWTPTGLTGIPVYDLTVQGNKIFAAMNFGILVSEDNGDTWSYAFTTTAMRSVRANQDFVFCGGYYSGVYVSSDFGSTWEQRNEGGMSGRTVISLFIANGYVYVGTEGQGAYRRPLDELVGIRPVASEVPENYMLSQNYPNPFNPETKISFDIPQSNKSLNVKLVISDVLGHEIAVLADEQLKPGKYEVKWNASGFASGVYYYTLRTDNFTETKKMILVK